MSKGRGILTENQRRYLRKPGGKANRSRIEERVEELPHTISKIKKDLEFLEKEVYLNEEKKKDFLWRLTNKVGEKTWMDGLMNGLVNSPAPYRDPPQFLGSIFGAILSYLIPSNLEDGKEKALIGTYESLFLKKKLAPTITRENFEEYIPLIPQENFDRLLQDFDRFKEKGKELREETKTKLLRTVKEMLNGVEELSEDKEKIEEDLKNKGVDTEIFRGVVSDCRLMLSSYFGRREKKGPQYYEQLLNEYVKKRHIFERQKISEKLTEDIRFLEEWNTAKREEINNRLEAIEFFRKGFGERNKNKKLDINSALRKKTNQGTSPTLVEIVANELSERDPPILKIEELDSKKHGTVNSEYTLTNYGKCLKDFLFKDLNPLDLDRKWEEFPDYWQNVLEHFTFSSSENELKEV